jgi:hypothetical protein
LGAAKLVPEAVFQLAMAYELGLFGLACSRAKAIKLYAALAAAPEADAASDRDEDDGSDSNEGSGGAAKERRPSSHGNALAASEQARLEAEERDEFASGGATLPNRASPQSGGSAFDEKKKKGIKATPAPVMATFGYQIRSPLLECAYDRNCQQTKGGK